MTSVDIYNEYLRDRTRAVSRAYTNGILIILRENRRFCEGSIPEDRAVKAAHSGETEMEEDRVAVRAIDPDDERRRARPRIERKAGRDEAEPVRSDVVIAVAFDDRERHERARAEYRPARGRYLREEGKTE